MQRKKNNSAEIPHQRDRSPAKQVLSIDKLVQEVIDSHRGKFLEKNIVVETDLSQINAVGDSELIKSAFASLIGNAQELMTRGGSLTVTLVDGNHQWELEVADNVNEAYSESALAGETTGTDRSSKAHELPMVIPFPDTEHLRNAARAAMSHGGHVQSWECPQGGTAYVLVIPKARNSSLV
jgi:hypothetical protein